MAEVCGTRWSDASALVSLQWAGSAAVAALALGLAGTVSVIAPAGVVLGLAAAWPKARSASLDRPAIRQLSRRVAALHGLTGPVLVGLIAAARPDWLEGAVPLATALAAAPFAAGAGFVLTLCGLSATADDWGPLNGGAP